MTDSEMRLAKDILMELRVLNAIGGSRELVIAKMREIEDKMAEFVGDTSVVRWCDR